MFAPFFEKIAGMKNRPDAIIVFSDMDLYDYPKVEKVAEKFRNNVIWLCSREEVPGKSFTNISWGACTRLLRCLKSRRYRDDRRTVRRNARDGRKGGISERLADEIYELFVAEHEGRRQDALYDWYSFVLKETKRGRTGNFTTTVPFVRIAEDVFALMYGILEALPARSRIEGVVAPRLPAVGMPGSILKRDRHMSARLLRAGFSTGYFPTACCSAHKRPAVGVV